MALINHVKLLIPFSNQWINICASSPHHQPHLAISLTVAMMANDDLKSINIFQRGPLLLFFFFFFSSPCKSRLKSDCTHTDTLLVLAKAHQRNFPLVTPLAAYQLNESLDKILIAAGTSNMTKEWGGGCMTEGETSRLVCWCTVPSAVDLSQSGFMLLSTFIWRFWDTELHCCWAV